MIEVRIELDALKEIEKKLDAIGMSGKSASIIKKAVNETARQAKKKLAVKAKESYTVKKGNFSEVMNIRGATTGNLTATIEAKSEPLPLTRFKISTGKRTTKAQILRDGLLKELKSTRNGEVRAFKNNIARKGQIRKKDTEKGKAGSAIIHIAVAQREGKERLHINEKYGPSIAAMLGSKHTLGKEEENIRTDLKESLEKHIKVLMEG